MALGVGRGAAPEIPEAGAAVVPNLFVVAGFGRVPAAVDAPAPAVTSHWAESYGRHQRIAMKG